MDLLSYAVIMAAVTTTYITFSKIAEPIRRIHYLFSCPLCLGFWVGMIFVASCEVKPPPYLFIEAVAGGLITGILAYILHSFLMILEKYSE